LAWGWAFETERLTVQFRGAEVVVVMVVLVVVVVLVVDGIFVVTGA
jgi:hypothetical protein